MGLKLSLNSLSVIVPSVLLVAGVCLAVYSKSQLAPPAPDGRQPATSPTDGWQPPLGPTQVVHTYWELSEGGDIERAKSYETNTDGRVIIMDSANVSSAEAIYREKLALLGTRDEIVEGDRAQLVAEVRNPNGTINTLQHNLHRKMGGWKILHIYSVDPLKCKYLPEMCNYVEQKRDDDTIQR